MSEGIPARIGQACAKELGVVHVAKIVLLEEVTKFFAVVVADEFVFGCRLLQDLHRLVAALGSASDVPHVRLSARRRSEHSCWHMLGH